MEGSVSLMIRRYATIAPYAVMNMDVMTNVVPDRPYGSCIVDDGVGERKIKCRF
jgi:hypothetical protein